MKICVMCGCKAKVLIDDICEPCLHDLNDESWGDVELDRKLQRETEIWNEGRRANDD